MKEIQYFKSIAPEEVLHRAIKCSICYLYIYFIKTHGLIFGFAKNVERPTQIHPKIIKTVRTLSDSNT